MWTFGMHCGVIVVVGLLLAAPYPCAGSGCMITDIAELVTYPQMRYKIECDDNANNLLDIIHDSDVEEYDLRLKYEMRNIHNTINTINFLQQLATKYNGNIKSNVSFTNSNFNSFPQDLTSIYRIRVIKITGSNITTVNLNMLPYATELEELDLSNNEIKDLETDPVSSLTTKQLHTVNLSHNKIDHIPVNCFFSIRESLETLDLSYNDIAGFDFYAFSSLTKLSTLSLSHNQLINLGLFLFPIRNIKHLNLDHNQINVLNSDLFSKSKSLKSLDISYNDIAQIDDKTFGALTELYSLSLSHNRISSIKEILLRNNTQLEKLDLCFNNISYIEPGTFSSMENLQIINIEHALSVSILGHSFTGLKVKSLNFAGSTIHEIEDRPFITLCNYLQSLNLSSSVIHKISETALESLIHLNELDLSNNYLTEIAFQTDDLVSLTKLNLQNNSIGELKSATFQHLASLTDLDLSNNNIKTIPPMIFKNLKALRKFRITNNALDTAFLSNTFFGLEKVEHLELIHTNVARFDSYAFTGLINLKVLNASRGQLSFLDEYAFAGTLSIEILDLSYNKLVNFNVKLLPNKNMKEVYLNNNEIRIIATRAFEGLRALKILDISNNNLVTIESSAFNSFVSLKHLNLSDNPNIKLNAENFKNMESLENVVLRNASNLMVFESGNITIRNIDISSSGITNLSSLCIYNIKSLEKLDLSLNRISMVNQYAFADKMASLTRLNLSHNDIEYLIPGAFLKTNAIRYLDLSHNKLARIPYGALNGLYNLKVLHLSNNLLTSFQLAQIHFISSISNIILDNNRIYSLSLPKFGQLDHMLRTVKVSVGGNELMCDDLLDLMLFSKFSATAEVLDFYSENIDGITCSSNEVIDT